ncbi:MAG: sulfotransferase [Betaproteobacteria bacterium]|nr:MAG: sulfotransferase [Betaproteobacteria bacterium]
MVTDKPVARNAPGRGTLFVGNAVKTLDYHGRRVMRATRSAWWSLRQPRLERPVFVVGCSRAGTTVVYKTFSAHPQLSSLNRETHDFWADLHPLQSKGYATHALGPADASDRDREIVSRYFYAHTGTLRIVDKNNQNGLCVAYLHALFPDAHFVYVKRSPGDNLHSLIEGWGKADEFATWSNDLPAKVNVDGGRYTRWCFFLAEGWRDYLDASIEEVCAFQYATINRAIIDARGAIPTAQWTEILYEDLVRDPVEGFRKAFVSAGLRFTSEMERYCGHVLETPFNAFSQIAVDKWKSQRNRARIERVLPAVAEVARQMGYEVE